jgi:C4-dicarboxylate-specific signal transduction histidine kinase
MAVDRPARRMTLRQLLTHSEKCSRDLAEHLHSTLLPRNTDCRELSRPIRRRSHYPTAIALLNALQKLVQAEQEAEALADYLHDQLAEIRDHAKREKVNRR